LSKCDSSSLIDCIFPEVLLLENAASGNVQMFRASPGLKAWSVLCSCVGYLALRLHYARHELG
jgi:hypothetical protein